MAKDGGGHLIRDIVHMPFCTCICSEELMVYMLEVWRLKRLRCISVYLEVESVDSSVCMA